MPHTRREFLTITTAAGLAAGAGLIVPALAQRALAQPAGAAKKKVLFLGGTGFIGPHIVRALLDAGHTVTLFNRGNRDELFPDLELITGNRITDIDPGLTPLKEAIDAGRTWDTVIDTANVHTWVENSASLLKDAASQYVFTSSMSVYADNSVLNQTEDGPVHTMPDEIADGIDRLPYDMNYFGAVKARCEDAARRHFGDRALIVRPGLIVGPRDYSHRFTYWPWRIRQGGDVLAPGAPDHPVMYLDARDLAAFLALNITNGTGGTFNINGPAGGPSTIGRLLTGINEALSAGAAFTWVKADWLAQHGVNPWAQMPVWIPPSSGMEGFHRKSIERAVKAGFTSRPLAETVRDTLAWLDNEYRPRAAEQDRPYLPGENAPGISMEREAELLAEWNQQQPSE
ncbi:MAG: NAD-dependent epimerase/dehydratase family protein [Phycisphaerales bacterium]